jgi:hypothetical protein
MTKPSESKPSRNKQIQWAKTPGKVTVSTGYVNGKEVAHVKKLRNHAPATRPSSSIYTVTVLEEPLARRYENISKARDAAEEVYALVTTPSGSAKSTGDG